MSSQQRRYFVMLASAVKAERRVSARPRTRPAAELIETAIPARLDRLTFGRFHALVVVALGITWTLDGLEVTLAGAVAGALKASTSLGMSNADVGLASSAYLAGAVLGALLFGWLTDRQGRKRLFFITLGVYLVATAATAFAWDFPSFALFRFSPGRASAANTRRSPRAFRSSCRRVIAAGQISSSTAAFGWAPHSVRRHRLCCSTLPSCRPISAGARPSSSAPCSGSSSW